MHQIIGTPIDRRYKYAVSSKPDNKYYLKQPAVSIIKKDDLKIHLTDNTTGWELFEQKKL